MSIGGDIIGAPDGSHGGGITATGNIASISILGSIVGGGGTSSGHVTAGGTLGRVFVGGNIVGSNSFFAEFGADSVESVGNMGSVVVGGSILGGKSSGTGSIHSNGKIASVTVRGDLIGGDTFFGLPYSGAIFAQGTDEGIRSIGRVAVGGSLVGGTGSFGGSIYGEDGIASATIMGSARGGSGLDSGSIVAGGKIGVVTVGGDLAGGMGANSGSVYLFNPALLSSVTVRGSVIGGSAGHTGIMSLGTIGTIRVLGSVRAESAAAPVHLSALGTIDPTTAAQAIAIRSVSISQSVTHAVIDVGYFSGTATNPDAQIGTVIVGGNWNGSSIVASVVANNGIFGDADDTALADSTPDLIVSRITAITIKGSAQGTLGGADGFGFVAQQVGSLKVGAATYPLTSGPSNDLAPIIVGTTGDLRVREV